jgi:4-carboxymuconolactone decarboxylase
MSAVAIAKDAFAERKIASDQLAPASPPPLPFDERAEAQRASRVQQQFGTVAPGVVQYTTDVLFRDLWRVPISRLGTAVSSPSVPSSLPAKSHSFRGT